MGNKNIETVEDGANRGNSMCKDHVPAEKTTENMKGQHNHSRKNKKEIRSEK